MKKILLVLACMVVGGSAYTHALVISEVMSNPVGDDSGREWIEIYNDSTSTVDLSTLTISIKGATAIVATPLSGGTTLPASGYAIIGSTVSGSTKFLQDYPSYAGILFKSAISLVNTGVTSIDIKLSGSVVDSLPSYTAAKEGDTLSLIGGSFVVGTPTPGADNQADAGSSSSGSQTASTTTNQVTVPQMSPPVADIIFYLPFEKTVVAGAEADFSTSATNHAGSAINNLTCSWAFGDGGQATGTSTSYRYAYTGRYVAQVEGTNGLVAGTARMNVRVVAPDIAIASIGTGKYGTYVDITNPNSYDLDLSQWRLSFNGQSFPFPKNTILSADSTTRISGLAMGFAKISPSANMVVKISFPNQEDVTSYLVPDITQLPSPQLVTATSSIPVPAPHKMAQAIVAKTTIAATTTPATSSVTQVRDNRLVAWVKTFFKK